MTLFQEIVTIALCALATLISRFLPFIVFSSKKPTPRFVQYLGKALPLAVFAMLVVYSLKNTRPLSPPHGIPELLSVALTAAVHVWKRQMLLSIALGTVCYMVLVQTVF